MKTMEWRTFDKSAWGPGPWQNEPDKMQYRDKGTGYPCLIVRNNSGALCGYVGVPKGHPAYEKSYDVSWYDENGKERQMTPFEQAMSNIAVHGGLTFADHCTPHAPEDWKKFKKKMSSKALKAEARKFPQGDAAKKLHDWGQGLESYEAYVALKQAKTICHIPGPDEPDDIYWLGFDCNHAGDRSPSYERYRIKGDRDTYKKLDYVKREIRSLAKQLKEIE
jgi:hypothetical protein